MNNGKYGCHFTLKALSSWSKLLITWRLSVLRVSVIKIFLSKPALLRYLPSAEYEIPRHSVSWSLSLEMIFLMFRFQMLTEPSVWPIAALPLMFPYYCTCWSWPYCPNSTEEVNEISFISENCWPSISAIFFWTLTSQTLMILSVPTDRANEPSKEYLIE